VNYIEGFVAAVPIANRNAYKKHAEQAALVFKDHGALKVVECWSDDVPHGKLTSFPMVVHKKDAPARRAPVCICIPPNLSTRWRALIYCHQRHLPVYPAGDKSRNRRREE
jgi:hypothetical protein